MGPATIPLLCERLTVEVDVEVVARCRLTMMLLSAGIEVGDVETERPVELQDRRHVAHDDVDLIEGRPVRHLSRMPRRCA
jgi:hypothetical protein